MSIDPGVIRAEPHTEIGLLIQRDVEILIERWSRRAIEEQPHAGRVHHQALVDHLHDLLRALGRSLAGSDDSATSQHCLPATIHGEQRWETGWSLPEVVRDYGILRLVIYDYVDEVLDFPPSASAIMAIGLALDEAIEASVTMYANSRDSYLRQLEAERAERDKQIQEHLRQRTETLKEVDRRKNEFIAILGHEMRNPLAPLWHAVSLLEMQETTDESLLQIRDITKRQVQQLTRLADDLLDISRIAQGKIELRKEPLDLAVVVAQAAQMSAPHMQARHHRFEMAEMRDPLWLEADPARLVQILGNLLNNAAKYTEHGGQVSLSAERDGQQAVIRVRDSGIGISPEMLPHIFELFTQGEWSVDDSHGGMGIGLALVRRLVELHGGTITATSAGLHQGSLFEVRLPLLSSLPAEGAAAARHHVEPPVASLTKPTCRRILVVDDNVDVTSTLRMLLSVQRHEVRVAHDGPAALEAARDFQPDVILLDIGLPRMDGYQVARRLRQEPGMKSVLLVAMTGYAQEEDRRRSQEAGFNVHLVKPVSLDTLRSAVAHVA